AVHSARAAGVFGEPGLSQGQDLLVVRAQARIVVYEVVEGVERVPRIFGVTGRCRAHLIHGWWPSLAVAVSECAVSTRIVSTSTDCLGTIADLDQAPTSRAAGRQGWAAAQRGTSLPVRAWRRSTRAPVSAHRRAGRPTRRTPVPSSSPPRSG